MIDVKKASLFKNRNNSEKIPSPKNIKASNIAAPSLSITHRGEQPRE